MKPVTFDMGRKQLTIDLDDISLRDRNTLIQQIGKIEEAHHPLSKWPKEKVTDEESGEERDETQKEWSSRVLDKIAKDYSKNTDESQEEFEKRVFRASMEDDIATIAYQVLEKAAKIVKVEMPTVEAFEDVKWVATRENMFTILSELNIPLANSFRPGV